MIQPGQGFNEYIATFINKLITSCSKHVQCFVQIEIIMAMEMSSDEIVDFLLRYGMQILQ